MRATSMPASASSLIIGSDSEAGPIVAMILVRRAMSQYGDDVPPAVVKRASTLEPAGRSARSSVERRPQVHREVLQRRPGIQPAGRRHHVGGRVADALGLPA